MIIPDINLLLYAYDASSPFHSKAVHWWQGCMTGTQTVGLPALVLFGFMRIGTHPRVFTHPMTPSEAAGHVRSWLQRPISQLLDPLPKHVEPVLRLLEKMGTAGNLVSDAQLAVLAMEHRAVLHTADADFLRFPNLHWFNPVTGMGSGKSRGRTTENG